VVQKGNANQGPQHLLASCTTTNGITTITNLTPSSVCAGTSLLAVLAVVADFNFVVVVVIVVVCEVAALEAVALGLCVTSSLNKPLT
jgi:hypothetical protein